MKPRTTAQLSRAALITTLYMVLTLVPPFNALSFGAVQFRLGEALVLLPFLLDEAVPGVVAGCLVANFFSPFGIVDVVVGTGVTLSAALLTRSLRRTRRAWLGAMPPILLNAVVVPLYVSTLTLPAATAGSRPASIGQALVFAWSHLSWSVYIPVAATILAGEAAVVLLLGLPLLGLVRRYMNPSREAL